MSALWLLAALSPCTVPSLIAAISSLRPAAPLSAMPSLAALLTQLQSYLLNFTQQNSGKKWATGIVLVLTIIWLYQR